MANIKRVRVAWSGGGVTGPGVSTLYFSAAASGFPADLQTFFQAIKAGIPSNVQIDVPNTGDLIDETTGALAGVWTDSGGSSTVGATGAVFAQGAGLRVRWVTGGVHNGRRVVGTTFIVPISSIACDTSGTVENTYRGVVNTAASAFVSAQAGDFVIWSKPTPAAPSSGESNAVLAAVVPDPVTGLRSRRT